MINLLKGVCLELMKDIPDESVDLIATDPPYPTTSRGGAGNSGGMLQKEINKKGQVFTYNNIDCSTYAPEFYRVLKDGSHCYVMTNHINLIKMLNTFTLSGFYFIKCLIWNKGNKIMGQYYMSQFEYVLFSVKVKVSKLITAVQAIFCQYPTKKQKTKTTETFTTQRNP